MRSRYVSHLDPVALAPTGSDCEKCLPGPLMQRQPDLKANADGSFTVHVSAGRMYTISSLRDESSIVNVSPIVNLENPAPAQQASPIFPLPLVYSFASDPVDTMPRFLNNYEGSFSIAKNPSHDDQDDREPMMALKQWVTRRPIVWHFADVSIIICERFFST
eukprot:COSAG01_NODE_10694_length_2103_cov_2.049955_3_plen_162_part_00